MIKRTTGLLALATLGLFLAAPVHATSQFIDERMVIAKRDRADDPRRESREDVRDLRDDRTPVRRDADRDAPPRYGYGYERRQQERFEEDSRPRGRR